MTISVFVIPKEVIVKSLSAPFETYVYHTSFAGTALHAPYMVLVLVAPTVVPIEQAEPLERSKTVAEAQLSLWVKPKNEIVRHVINSVTLVKFIAQKN